MSETYKRLIYSSYGDLSTQLSLVEEPVPTTLQQGEALVRVLLSPINPSDVSTIRGRYASKPPLPSTPGYEGVAEVVKSSTGNFQPGDRVLISTKYWGMWRQVGVAPEADLVRVPKELPNEAAATLIVNPCTAYVMLKEIIPLVAGDCVIQNGANSALGQVVIQLANAAGIKTINVIRNRSDLQETVDMLKKLGADAVITDEQLKNGLDKLNLGLPAPMLALECVGGEATAHIAAALANGGTVVSYGSMSGKPVYVSQQELIFRDIRVIGFWLTKWIMEHKAEDFGQLLEGVVKLYVAGKLQLPKFRVFPVEEWREAVKNALSGFTNEKTLIKFN